MMNSEAETTDDRSEMHPESPKLSLRPDDDVMQGPEKRLFDHIRNWVDVFPWLRLVRVCRVAGGPVWITHAFLVFVIWAFGLNWLVSDRGIFSEPISVRSIIAIPVWTSASPSDAIVPLVESVINIGADRESRWFDWKVVLWTIVVWLPTSMAFLRVGAMLTAGRDMPSYVVTFRDVFGRIGGGALIVILPSLVASLFWLVSFGLTWLADWVAGPQAEVNWAAWVTLPIVLPSTLIAAVLVLGGKFATPLGLAALMIESDPDPLDSLSRGYEYTLRRLPQLVLLIVVAVAIASVVIAGWVGICLVGGSLASTFGPPNRPLLQCLACLPSVVAVMFGWSMAGGIYLLLRQSAGGQEVEDIAVNSDHWKSPKLPSVQSQ
ncbi:hypothetical protein [Rhodopirellula sp. SWK7]|uniref:hypothetical protein n=1 Tax=Rhodopirellula sp. SWK7 TaxID=595460 RepID=UPI0002BFB195|nr:hypothetical protein [Rhodopirellula sp. SWK7]EMI45159.1 membrane protein containing DUF1558 [Rhodopirellula sp. SWK7]